MVKTKIFQSLIFFMFTSAVYAQDFHWSLFSYYNQPQLQRGLQIYRQVCSNCHSLNYVPFDALKDLGYNKEQISYLKKHFKNNYFPKAFKTIEEARKANNGANPPDLSNIVKQRTSFKRDGASYIADLLTSFQNTQKNGAFANSAYVGGLYINMPPSLSDNLITYHDGTEQTTQQYAKDIAAFLSWCSNPKLNKQHQLGFCVLSFLSVFTILIYGLKKSYEQNQLYKDKYATRDNTEPH